jgi:hypothetical protein
MADAIRTGEQIEDVFREVALAVFGLDPAASASRVRFPWGSSLKEGMGSAPSWKKSEDVCMVYALPHDDPYGQQRDRKTVLRDGGLVSVDEHTDVHLIMFANYGPNAYECARALRDGFFSDGIRLLLRGRNFALAHGVPSIKRIPELHSGEWWNRVDTSAVFNEYVRLEHAASAFEGLPAITAAPGFGEGWRG